MHLNENMALGSFVYEKTRIMKDLNMLWEIQVG